MAYGGWISSSFAVNTLANINAGRDDGLFSGAIAESGGPAVNFFYASGGGNSSHLEDVYQTLLNRTNCTSVDCLRTLPFTTLNNAMNTTNGGPGPYGPVIDGDFVQTYGSDQLESGAFVKVPLIIGTNSDEGTAFGSGYGPNGTGVNTDADFAAAVASGGVTNETVKIIEYLYPNIPAIVRPLHS